jgi:hypothetical protein
VLREPWAEVLLNPHLYFTSIRPCCGVTLELLTFPTPTEYTTPLSCLSELPPIPALPGQQLLARFTTNITYIRFLAATSISVCYSSNPHTHECSQLLVIVFLQAHSGRPAIMTEPESAGNASPTTPNAPRRPRAPTITLDTSAVSPPLLEDDSFLLHPVSDQTHAIQGEQAADQDHPHSQPPLQQRSPSELRVTPSYESRGSRPASPHNISSPTSKWMGQPQGFLAVPNTRSRGNAVGPQSFFVIHDIVVAVQGARVLGRITLS